MRKYVRFTKRLKRKADARAAKLGVVTRDRGRGQRVSSIQYETFWNIVASWSEAQDIDVLAPKPRFMWTQEVKLLPPGRGYTEGS